MSFTGMLTQPATIYHQAGTGALDDYNQPATVATTEQAMTFIEPLAASEDATLRDTGRSSVRSFWEPDVDLDVTDRVVVAGTTYEVVGPPQPMWKPPIAAVHHYEVLLAAAR